MEKSSCCYFCFSCLSLVLYESSDSEHSLYNISDWKEKIKVNRGFIHSYAMTRELENDCELQFEVTKVNNLDMWRIFCGKTCVDFCIEDLSTNQNDSSTGKTLGLCHLAIDVIFR